MGKGSVLLLLSVMALGAWARNPIGWDPGMTQPKGVGISLDRTMVPWSYCPQQPGGNCDSIPGGGGFYSLSVGSDYVVNNQPQSRGCPAAPLRAPMSEHPIMAPFGLPPNVFHNVRCPYGFEWGYDGGLVATMAINSEDFGNDMTPNIYIGLQRNLNVPPNKGGVSFEDRAATPMFNEVDEVEFRYRAAVCDRNVGQFFFGRGLYILEGYNPTTNSGFQLSVNVFEYLRGVQRHQVPGILVDGIKAQNEMAAHNEHFSNTWHMNGAEFPNFVELPGPYKLQADNRCLVTPDGGWYQVKIKVKKLISYLIQTHQKFPKDPTYWGGMRWVGGTFLGAEFLGRGRVVIQVRDFFHYNKPGAPPIHGTQGSGSSSPSPSPAPSPSPPSGGGGHLDQILSKLMVNAKCGFDHNNYLQWNPDVRNAGLTSPAQAVDHYLRYGIREGRPGGCPPSREQLPSFLGREEEMPVVLSQEDAPRVRRSRLLSK